jgi:phage anti-repressor protein
VRPTLAFVLNNQKQYKENMVLLFIMEMLNIVDLIENTPITKLSGAYNNKFISRIKENFTETQQKLFVSSFYCFLNYSQTNDFVIDLDNIWEWLGFSQKFTAKRVLERHFTVEIDYKISTHRSVEQDKRHGGNNKEKIMLNIQTFKLFCIKSDTKKADEIHRYFLKLEFLLQEVIQEESNELKIQLEQKGNLILDIENKNKLEYAKLLKEKELEKQNILLTEYSNKTISLVYIIKVKSFINGEYIVKIGESRRGIVDRFAEHKTNYEEVLLLDCFGVNRSKDFESFLHNHVTIKDSRVSDLEGHLTEKELFLIGKNLTYSTLMNVIKTNINHFEYNNNELEKMRIEYESLKLITEINSSDLKTIIQQLVSNNKLLLDKIDRLEGLILKKLDNDTPAPKLTTGFNTPLVTLGPRLQKINPETLQLVRVYETVSECMNENINIKRPSLNKAEEECTVYNGFRWKFVPRDQDASVLVSIEKTKETRTQNIGYIAKLNKEKTEILNVYLDRKNASSFNGYKSLSGLDTCVKNFTLSNGNYYLLYDSCEDELKEKFVEKYGKPLLYKDGVGQFDTNGIMTQEFGCKYDCIRGLKISDKTIEKCLNKDIVYNSYSYKSIGSKLKVHDN